MDEQYWVETQWTGPIKPLDPNNCHQEYTMTKQFRKVPRTRAMLTAACVFLSSYLWAQSSSNTANVTSAAVNNSSTDPAATVTDTTAAKSSPNIHDDAFVIGADDVVAINVWKEPEISRSIPVRSDGKISLPLAGEVQASGTTPKQLEAEISKRLASYISEPEVTVIVQQIKSQRFNILGQVARPGSYPLSNPTTVLDAIALAGGCRESAKQKASYVLRVGPDGSKSRI